MGCESLRREAAEECEAKEFVYGDGSLVIWQGFWCRGLPFGPIPASLPTLRHDGLCFLRSLYPRNSSRHINAIYTSRQRNPSMDVVESRFVFWITQMSTDCTEVRNNMWLDKVKGRRVS